MLIWEKDDRLLLFKEKSEKDAGCSVTSFVDEAREIANYVA